MEQLGKALIVVGLFLVLVGGMMALGVFRWLRLGRLPGDFAIERPGFSFYFPFTTMLLIGLVVTVVSWLVAYFRR